MAAAKKKTRAKKTGTYAPPTIKHVVELVQGVAGPCVYLNGFRIVGDKPWGGGTILKRWALTDKDLREATGRADPEAGE